jgi:hypothetical protein
VLRSLAIVLGAAFIPKFIVLAALADPQGGPLKRVLLAMLEGVTLGTLAQVPLHAATGYAAFGTVVLFLAGVAMLPPPSAPLFEQTPRSAASGLLPE